MEDSGGPKTTLTQHLGRKGSGPPSVERELKGRGPAGQEPDQGPCGDLALHPDDGDERPPHRCEGHIVPQVSYQLLPTQ
jgi:hypothetical protein